MSTGLAHRCYSASGLQFKSGLSWTAAGPLAVREFSSSSRRCEEGGDRRPPPGRSDPATRRNNANTELRSIFAKSSASSQNGPNTPGRPVDARSFRAVLGDKPSGPTLRPTLSIKNLQQNRDRDRPGNFGGNRSGNFRGNRFGDRSGNRSGDRSQSLGPGGYQGRGRFAAKPQKGQMRRPRGPRPQQEDSARFVLEEDDGDDSDIVYEREKRERERPKPERYTPENYDVAKLQETWPAFPMGDGDIAVANRVNVVEKMGVIGERYVGSYEPPNELAKMFLEGKAVYFKSEEEKAEVMGYVKQMSEERAQMLTIRKKEVVEPEEAPFEVMNAGFVEHLVQGKYDDGKVDGKKFGGSPIIANALRNLENNQTYHSPEGRKFMEKLAKSLPAAKPKAAPAKQVRA